MILMIIFQFLFWELLGLLEAFDFGVGMTLQDVLLQAGGLTQQAEGSRVEVSRIMDYDISSNKLKPRMTIVKTIKIGDDFGVKC